MEELRPPEVSISLLGEPLQVVPPPHAGEDRRGPFHPRQAIAFLYSPEMKSQLITLSQAAM